MQHYCTNCSVYTKQKYCPLCKRKLSDKTGDNEYYPVYETKVKRRRFAQRLVLFIAIFGISTSLLINLLTNPERLWFLYVLGPVLYGVLTINHTFLSRAHTGSKVVLQVISLSVMLFILDAASGSSKWSIHYVIPFLVTLATFFCNDYCAAEANEMAGIHWIYVNDGHSRLSTRYPILKLLVHCSMAECSNCFICSADINRHDTYFQKNNEE